MYQLPVSAKDSVMLPYGLTYRIEELERKVHQLETQQSVRDATQSAQISKLIKDVSDILARLPAIPGVTLPR